MRSTSAFLTLVLAVVSLLPAGAQTAVATGSSGPQHIYRLRYTVTEWDGGRQVNVQHATMTSVPAQGSLQRADLSKDVTYLDVVTNVFARVMERAEGVEVHTWVNQSRGVKAQGLDKMQPIQRGIRLEFSATVTPGKTVRVGSIGAAESTRRSDVDLMVERVR